MAAEIHSLGLHAQAIELDVSDRSSPQACVGQVLQLFSRLDILVNNSGVFQKHLGLQEDEAEFYRCLDINLIGIWRMVQAAIPQPRAQRRGKIVNIASVGGRQGVDFAPASCASKAAVINLTQSLAAALGADHINVNTMCPGSVDIAMQDEITVRKSVGARHMFEHHPLSTHLTPQDVGYAKVFFASDARS